MVREEPKKAQKRSGRRQKRLRNGPGGAQKLSGRSPKKGSEMVRLAESSEMVREEPYSAGVLSRGALVGVLWWRGGSSGCSGGVLWRGPGGAPKGAEMVRGALRNLPQDLAGPVVKMRFFRTKKRWFWVTLRFPKKSKS